jgi:Putative peptidoglycan binding domain
MDANSFLKRITLIALITALPTFVSASSPGGGGHSSGGGGGHSAGGFGGGRAGNGGRSFAGMHGNAGIVRPGPALAGNSRNFRNGPSGPANWHGNNAWRNGNGDWNGHGNWRHGHETAWHRHNHDEEHEHHHRDRFFFGFFPYWYPGWGYYDYGYYGYPYYSDYSYDYPDYYYPDYSSYSGRNGSASIQVLVQGSLARRGYYDGPVDGVVGSGTRSAIREFQRDNGLPVTGHIDSQLVQALQNGRD